MAARGNITAGGEGGSKPSSEAHYHHHHHPHHEEDELVTWLQYPLDDSLEKSYCSDLFVQWPSLPPSPNRRTPVTSSTASATASTSAPRPQQHHQDPEKQPIPVANPRSGGLFPPRPACSAASMELGPCPSRPIASPQELRPSIEHGSFFSRFFPAPNGLGSSRSSVKEHGSSSPFAAGASVEFGHSPLATSVQYGLASSAASSALGSFSPSTRPASAASAVEYGLASSAASSVLESFSLGTRPAFSEQGNFPSRSLVESEPVSKSLNQQVTGSVMGSGHGVGKGAAGFLCRSVSADGALALGAGRAAGLVPQTGLEAFNKVRTSRQPPQTHSLSSMREFSPKSLHPTGSTSLGLPKPFSGKQPMTAPSNLQTVPGAKGEASRAAAISPPKVDDRLGHCILESSTSTSTVSLASHILSNHKIRKVSDVPFSSAQQQGGCSHVTEEVTARRASDHSSSASSRAVLCSSKVNRDTLGRLSVPSKEGPNNSDLRGSACGVSDTACLASRSGGSQTSADISVREATSGGKRKLQDLDCLSEDLEDDSMESRQPRKGISKRNRAAEVHNLSEKRRRSKINEKMKALQELIPNSSKTDKASMLEEAIEYMKALQLQLQMVSLRSGMNPVMIPTGMPHLQMAQMAPLHPIGVGVPIGHAGMGMGMMDLSQSVIGRPCHSVPGAMSHFSLPFQTTGLINAQDCSQPAGSVHFAAMDYSPYENGTHQLSDGSAVIDAGCLSYGQAHQQLQQPTFHPHRAQDSMDGQDVNK